MCAEVVRLSVLQRFFVNTGPEVSFCMKLNNLLSQWFKVNIGVRQGDNLSPTLFSLFINDLAIEIKKYGTMCFKWK